MFAIVALRYITSAVFYRWLLKFVFGPANIDRGNQEQVRREVMWSVLSSALFAILSVATYLLFDLGYTQIYTEFSERSFGYFVGSIVAFLLLYETYYYWLHRWMHLPSVFRIVHRVHHQSMSPTVFTSFSFHPLEALLQFLFIPLTVMVLPIHYGALGVALTMMTISAVINHAGIEIFPKSFSRHAIGKWLIGSTHHDLHHKEFKTNFGLYFNFWDKMMKTENPKFEKQFEMNKDLISRSRSPHHPSMDGPHK